MLDRMLAARFCRIDRNNDFSSQFINSNDLAWRFFCKRFCASCCALRSAKGLEGFRLIPIVRNRSGWVADDISSFHFYLLTSEAARGFLRSLSRLNLVYWPSANGPEPMPLSYWHDDDIPAAIDAQSAFLGDVERV